LKLLVTMQFLRTTFFTIAAILSLHAAAFAGDAYKWSVQYLIDNSQTIFGKPMRVYPRAVRGLAISADGKYLYAGFMHSFDGRGEVRKLAIDAADYERAVSTILPGPLAKAISVDDKNRVYITDRNDVVVYDGDLERKLFRINAGVCDGVCAVREGGVLVLYATEREEASLQRYVLTEKGGDIVEAKLGGFDGTGVFHIPGCIDPRNVRADAKGNLWVADLKGHKVFRIRKDAKELKSVEITTPIDIAFDKGRTFVTCWEERSITVLDDDMIVLGNLRVPWEELELAPFGNNRDGALSGIVGVPGKGFFVANEDGETANQKSTYGKLDEYSGLIDGKLFKDIKNDDNDPILRATVVDTQ
jgi:sugar lactone lactonase YvrE